MRIPDLVIRGQPVSIEEIDAAEPLPRDRFVVVPDAGHAAEARSPTWARDLMLQNLVQSGDRPDQARAIADRTATRHDRRSR